MSTTERRLLSGALTLGLLLAGCGDAEESARTSDGVSGSQDSQAEDAPLAPVDTKGDPRDLMSLSNLGDGVTFATYDTYEQLRDYSDLAVIGAIETITVVEPFEDPQILPGELQVDVRVDAVLGGRMTDVNVGDSIAVMLPLHATPELLGSLEDRLANLTGARYAFFLFQAKDPPRRYAPILHNAPPAVLAEWPGDGRLTDFPAHDYLAREAIERGVERTGVPYEGEPKWSPTFEGPAPIGLTVEQAANDFAGTPGKPEVDPPEGWEQLEPRLAPAHGAG